MGIVEDLIDDSDVVELHRHDDPEIYGVADVDRGRTPWCPVTVYERSGDSASGVAGLLKPEPWEYLPVLPTKVGSTFVLEEDGETFELTTTWDGAVPSPEFVVTLPDGRRERRREHTKGVLLSNYDLRGLTARLAAMPRAVYEKAL